MKNTVLAKVRDYLHGNTFILLKNVLGLSAANMQKTNCNLMGSEQQMHGVVLSVIVKIVKVSI